ncbi:MAG: MlaD family protein [Chlamydiia bacterium]
MTSNTSKNLLIGAFVLAACGIIMWVLLALKPTVGDQGQTVRALFSDISKVARGTQVNYAGRPVGEVVQIIPAPDPQHTPVDAQGRHYVYEVVMNVDSHVKLYDTDQISLTTSGLLGEKMIAITPQSAPKGTIAHPLDGQMLLANSNDALDTVVFQVGNLAKSMGSTMETITDFIHDNQKDFNMALVQFGKAMRQVDQALAAMDQGGLYQSFPATVKSLQSITHALDQPEELRSMVANLDQLCRSLAQVGSQLEQGEGSLGALIQKPEAYQQLDQLLRGANTTIRNINCFGLLFHNNKRWARIQQEPSSNEGAACPAN